MSYLAISPLIINNTQNIITMVEQCIVWIYNFRCVREAKDIKVVCELIYNYIHYDD